MASRLLRGIGANCYGQAATLLIQLLSVPLLIRAWGVAGYGTWITISALPAVLSLSDCGLIVATGTAMTMATGRGDRAAAALLFHRAASRVATVAVACAFFAVAIVMVGPDRWLPEAAIVNHDDARIALYALVGVVLLGVAANLLAAGFRANGDYALGLVVGDTIRMVEAAAVVIAGVSGYGLTGAAEAWLLIRLFGQAVSLTLLLRRAPWLFRYLPASRQPAPPSMRRPAAAALCVPIAFMISLQGITLVVSAALSPAAVALFGATRTLTRAMVQASGLLNHAVIPEISLAEGRRDASRLRRLKIFNLVGTATMLGFAWVLILVLGPAIMSHWSGGRLDPDPVLLILLASAALVHGLWLSAANLLLAVNRQHEYAFAFVAVSLSVCALAAAAARFFGLHGVGAVLLGGEVVMAMCLIWVRYNRVGRPSSDLPGAEIARA